MIIDIPDEAVREDVRRSGAMRVSRRVGLALLLAALCVLPFVLSGYHTFQVTMVIIYAIALFGLNLLTGYNGQISLGHGAFYAIGAYTSAIMMDSFGAPYYTTIPAAGLICLVSGFLFGLPALRLEGLYLALATFSLAIAVPQMLKVDAVQKFTGGTQGVYVAKPDPPPGLPIDSDQWLYFLALAIAVLMFALGVNLLKGRIGRALIAIRDHPTAAKAMGVNTSMYKATTFGISALYTGIAGALGAITVQFIGPDSFTIFLSIGFLVGVVVGGIASIPGAIFGAVFIQFIPNVADQISKSAPWAIYGIFLIAFMYLMPTGIAGALKLLLARIEKRLAERRGFAAANRRNP